MLHYIDTINSEYANFCNKNIPHVSEIRKISWPLLFCPAGYEQAELSVYVRMAAERAEAIKLMAHMWHITGVTNTDICDCARLYCPT